MTAGAGAVKGFVRRITGGAAEQAGKQAAEEATQQAGKETAQQAGKQAAEEAAQQAGKETAQQAAKEIAEETGEQAAKATTPLRKRVWSVNSPTEPLTKYPFTGREPSFPRMKLRSGISFATPLGTFPIRLQTGS